MSVAARQKEPGGKPGDDPDARPAGVQTVSLARNNCHLANKQQVMELHTWQVRGNVPAAAEGN